MKEDNMDEQEEIDLAEVFTGVLSCICIMAVIALIAWGGVALVRWLGGGV